MKIGFQVEHKHEILKIEPKGRKARPDLQYSRVILRISFAAT